MTVTVTWFSQTVVVDFLALHGCSVQFVENLRVGCELKMLHFFVIQTR